ncbi:cyclic GMP-AMP synthase DncV-like nucleotidyltransferase [Sphingomonas aurantiaca]|uniref:cyclic GMP-AMP synthase DncV-like nucleotidyltransferase n=1 Tax=Sphingomonas aurantiaca TaxID=185949 RepID=UPI003362736B
MFDCSKDVRAFHDKKVTLPKSEQEAMRDRRDANRRRLRKGLEANDDPAAKEFVKQGSYAMLTMTQHPDNDYDIDDGVYFLKEDLVGARGGELSAFQAREMVRDAVDDGSFKDAPEVRGNCVRIFYAKGYHVDMPVYRTVTEDDETYHELASSSGWRRSDARDVTQWYEDKRAASGDGIQLRRLTREVKKFARSRTHWCSRILSGFGITALVVEKLWLDADREDVALYETMKAMRDRLNCQLDIDHPVTKGDKLATADSAKSAYLRDRLTDAIGWLAPLFESDCTREKALGCWDKAFNTTFFSERGEDEARAASVAGLGKAAVASTLILGLESQTQAAVRATGGGRHA